MAVYDRLQPSHQTIILDFIHTFCARTEFLTAPGLGLGIEASWVIAANAALVGACQPTNCFECVEWVYLCDPDDLNVDGDVRGVQTVRLDARSALEESRQIIPGRNVIVHEFVHVLDHLLSISGAHLPFRTAYQAYEVQIEQGKSELALDSFDPISGIYGQQFYNAVEFLAYTSELYFTSPHRLQQSFPKLPQYFAQLYGLDMLDVLKG